LQRDAACCSVLQYVAALLQRVAHIPMADGSGVAGLAHSLPCVVYYSVLQCVAVCCSMLQRVAEDVAVRYSVLLCVAVRWHRYQLTMPVG